MSSRYLFNTSSKVRICVDGITFRQGVKELFHSRNLAFARLLKEKKLNVFVHDKMFTKEEVKKLGFNWLEPKKADIIFESFKNRFVISKKR